jgi:small multidrug resistance pump
MNAKLLALLYLILGVVFETIATSSLPFTKSFTRVLPSAGVLVLYILGLFFLTLSIKVIPIGIAYAFWAGLGIVLVAIFGFIVHGQKLDTAAMAGIVLILAGILIINIFSKSTQH